MSSTEIADDFASSLALPDLEADPYPAYARLRATNPVTFVPALDSWLVTRFEDVKRVHQDPEVFQTRFVPATLESIGEHNVLNLDGERHQRYRRALHGCLAPKVVEGYADDAIGTVVRERADALEGKQGADLVAEYFEPISVLALGRVMGIPDVDADTLRRWFRGVITASSNTVGDPDVTRETNAVSKEIDDRLWSEFERIDAEPSDTIISHLLQRATGDTLAERVEDISPTLKIVIGGGLQEPGHGAATLAWALLSDPAAAKAFRAGPATATAPAIEEALRWVSPIGIDTRLVAQDVELGGTRLPAGSWIFASNSSANRDELQFGETADRYDPHRPKQRHMGFGFGSHFCSGNYFGRVVMRMSASELLTRFPDVRFDPERPSAFRGFFFRAPGELHALLR